MAVDLFILFFKTGLFCFGGGSVMIGFFDSTLVHELGYLTSEQFADMVAISQITPGPIAVNFATYTGAVLGRTFIESVFLSFVATFAITLPAFIYVLAVAKLFDEFGNSNAAKGIMSGIKPGIIGLILVSVITLCQLSILNPENNTINLASVLIIAVSFAVSVKRAINPFVVMVGAGFLGMLIL